MQDHVADIQVNDLDRAARVLSIGPDVLLRALLGSSHNVEDVNTDSIA